MDVLSILIEFNGWLVSLNQVVINNLFALSFAILALLYREKNNILFIVSLILAPKLLDILIFNESLLSDFLPNYAFYLVYSAYDLVVVFMILYRVSLMKNIVILKIRLLRFLGGNIASEATFLYERHIKEYKIIVVFLLSIFINIIVCAEYPYRFYINENALYLYYLYIPVKLVLNFALVYLIWSLRKPKVNFSKGV